MRKEGSSKARQHNDNDNQGISSYLIHHKNRLIWYSDPVRGSKSDQIICMLCSSVGAVEFAEDVEGSDEANKQSDMMRAPWWVRGAGLAPHLCRSRAWCSCHHQRKHPPAGCGGAAAAHPDSCCSHATLLRGSMTAGWVPASTPPIKDWDYKEERAMHDNVVLSLKEGRR